MCWGVGGDVGRGMRGGVGKCDGVSSPHFEKVKGDVGIVGKCVGVWGEMWEEV